MSPQLRALSFALLMLPAAQVSADAASPETSRAFTFEDPQLQWGPCPPFLPEGCEIAVLHGDPAQPNVDVFFKVPGGSTIPSHTHTSAERMVLVSGALDVTYDGEPTRKLRPGMYAYGPAQKPHSAACAKGAPCVLFIAFESPLDATPTAASAR
jgi:quercetin dioxygenase-like cupin family protein